MVVEGVPVAVHPRTAPVLGPPVRDGVWIMFNGPDSRHHHWRAVFGDQGVPRIGQRFAADWLKLNADGVFFTGTGKRNEDYPCFGEDLVAMADGVVVLARDGLEDINPGEAPHTEDWQTANDIGGNHVLLSIGGGLYIFYAHMQKGSIVVREGEVVRRGDVLGKLGNSGNSDAPHLHLHVMSGQRALHDVGLPYRLAAYEHLGWWNTFEEDIPAGQGYDIAGATAVRYTEDLPRANAIIRILDEAGATIAIGEDAAFTSSTGRLVARNVSTGDGYVTMELTWSAGAGAFVLDNVVATPEAYPRDGAAWDATAGTLRLPRVRVGTQVYAVTLRRTETGGMAFALESATPWP
jgi:murein DD-endopeptidase MepM/ murein hydrolase activator NlpD